MTMTGMALQRAALCTPARSARQLGSPSRRAATGTSGAGSSSTSSTSSSGSSSTSSPSSSATATLRYTVTELRGTSRVIYTPAADGVSLDRRVAAAKPASRQASLLDALRNLYLPAGYPASTTPDYLRYQLWTLPAHVTGWISIGLTTSSLLKAVGFSAGPVGATAAAAGIKWITKDGLGAIGRLLVGGRFGREFDADPQRWRMIAEFVTTTGMALEVATSAYPAYFLVLAGAGNFTKALGKGMGRPVFRVIQTHFAAAGNVGAVAAKEEVWEVTGQLAGYAASVVLLKALEGSGQAIVTLWALTQAAHIGFRYAALTQLAFPSLNQKRACALAAAHVAGQQLPGVDAGNRAEPLLAPATSVRPAVCFGVPLEQAILGPAAAGQGSPAAPAAAAVGAQQMARVLELYRQEEYVLGWHEGTAYVALKDGHGDSAFLRAIWQAAWLDADGSGSGGGSSDNGSSGGGGLSQQEQRLQASLAALAAQYAGFVAAAEQAGWDCGMVRMVLAPGAVTFHEAEL